MDSFTLCISNPKPEFSLKSKYLPHCSPQILNSSNEDKSIDCGSIKSALDPILGTAGKSHSQIFSCIKKGPALRFFPGDSQLTTLTFCPHGILLLECIYVSGRVVHSGKQSRRKRVGVGNWAVVINQPWSWPFYRGGSLSIMRLPKLKVQRP